MQIYKRILCEEGGSGGGGGTGTLAFDPKIHAPEEFRSEPSLAAIKTVQDLTKGYVSAQKLIGAKRIALPSETAAPAEWEAFYTQIGRPDAPEKYTVPEIKDMDPSLKLDGDRLKAAQKVMFDSGLTPKQARTLMEYYMTSTDGQVKAAKTSQEVQSATAITGLKQEWGDKYTSNVDVAKSVVKKFGGEEFATYLEQSGMGNNIPLIKMLHKFGMAILEDKDRGGPGAGLELTDQTRAEQEIANLKQNADFQKVLGDARSPGHKEAVARWTNLFAVAYPSKQGDDQ